MKKGFNSKEFVWHYRFQFPAILMKMVMQNKKFLIETLLYFPILYNLIFFRSLNFFFPAIIFVIDRKFVLFKLYMANFFLLVTVQ